MANILFATILVFVSAIWGKHARIIDKSRSRMAATFLAERVLETAINDGYMALDPTVVAQENLSLTTTIHGQPNTVVYNCTTTVANETTHPDKLRVVTVTVQFPTEDSNSAFHEV